MTLASFNSSRWFVCPQPKAQAQVRLFLFPYAGGAPTAFNKWSVAFPENVETWIAHYPGRGSRHNEPAIKDLHGLVEKIEDAIQPLLDRPFVFFGHSLGGMVAFEVARRLSRGDLPRPQSLFISACGAPDVPDPHPPIHALPGDEFIRSLEQLNGIPSEVAHHSELMQLLEPTLRADFEAIEKYQYTSDQQPLPTPIVAFGGSDDPRVSRERLEGWASHTNAGFKLRYFSGDHFFINAARESVITSIIDEIASSHTDA
jgi:medium-chain acyl-[acyl-carrier-protein] hydrolase